MPDAGDNIKSIRCGKTSLRATLASHPLQIFNDLRTNLFMA